MLVMSVPRVREEQTVAAQDAARDASQGPGSQGAGSRAGSQGAGSQSAARGVDARHVAAGSLAPHEVLVRIAVRADDERGSPGMHRLACGVRSLAGVDVAGEVLAVGSDVTRLRVGDSVFGRAPSSGDEVAVPAWQLAHVPKGTPLRELASLPLSGVRALQALRDEAEVQDGERVLVAGADTQLGRYVVQLARYFGADVTAATSSEDASSARAYGAHDVDTERDWETGAFDVVIDARGTDSLASLVRALRRRGRYVGFGDTPRACDLGLWARLHAWRKNVTLLRVEPDVEAHKLGDLAALLSLGEIRAVTAVAPRAEATPQLVSAPAT